MEGAILSNVNLAKANLSDANLYKANLQQAQLIGADLTGANIANCNITEANTTGAIFKDIFKDAIPAIEEKPINEELQITDAENDITARKDNNSDLSSGAPIRSNYSKLSSYEQHSSVSNQDKDKDKNKQMNVDTPPPQPIKKDNEFVKDDSHIPKVASFEREIELTTNQIENFKNCR